MEKRKTASICGDYNANDDAINTPDEALTSYSEKDKPWDTHRGESQDVQGIYGTAEEFERYAERIGDCSGVLRFGMVAHKETGELSLKLRRAQFCRVRHCPVCQWRRSLMWQARFYKSLPGIVEEFPKARWLFLTLTTRNCEIGDLKDQLTEMNKAWQRLIKRKEFAPVQGWLRATEVTRGKDGSAHPHFHILLMVPPTMFTKHYIKQSRWTELWAESMRLSYTPIVDVRTVKPRAPKEGQEATDTVAQALQGAVSETLKYSVKPSDMVTDSVWFLEMTRQVHKKRFIASGGALKNVLKDDEETNDDLILADEPADGEQEADKYLYAFNWRSGERRYRRFEKGDILLDDD